MESRHLYQPDDPCSQLAELLPAYGMSLCDPEEALEIEALLERCPEFLSELDEYRQLAAYMPYTAEAKSAPPQLLNRILNAAAASGAASVEAKDSRPADTTRRAARLSTADTARETPPQTVKTIRLTETSDEPSNVIPFDAPRMERTQAQRSRTLISTLAAAIALILFVGVNLFWSGQVTRQEAAIEETRDLLKKSFDGDQLIRFDLGSVDQASPGARGTVWCHPDNRVAVVRAENLPLEAQEQNLRVWLWAGDQREEAGAVWINDQGRGMTVINASQPLANYDYVVIAQPPSANSNQQARPFMRGNLYGLPRSTEAAP